MGYHDALAFVRTRRAVVRPNSAFQKQLQLWENSDFSLPNVLIEDQEKDSAWVVTNETGEDKEGLGKRQEEVNGGEVMKHDESKGSDKKEEQDQGNEGDANLEEDGGNKDNKTEGSPLSPTPENLLAAIKSLYLKHPAMGRKKMLRILNEQGWHITKRCLRSHLNAIVADLNLVEMETGNKIDEAEPHSQPSTLLSGILMTAQTRPPGIS